MRVTLIEKVNIDRFDIHNFHNSFLKQARKIISAYEFPIINEQFIFQRSF